MKIHKGILIFVITLCMLNNVEHLAAVHYDLAKKFFTINWMNVAHSVIVVIIFEVVVITFVILGKKGFSKFFTFCIWILSMIYYDADQLIMDEKWIDLVAATVYSTIFTFSIYMFSDMLAEYYQENRLADILKKKIEEFKAQLKEKEEDLSKALLGINHQKQALQYHQNEIQNLKATIESLHTENAANLKTLEKYQQADKKRQSTLTCPYCKTYVAESDAQLRSHKGHCPDNPKNKKS